MRYNAVYKDTRDNDLSWVEQGMPSIDTALDSLAFYFACTPDSVDHLEYWQVINESGKVIESGKTVAELFR